MMNEQLARALVAERSAAAKSVALEAQHQLPRVVVAGAGVGGR